jgi:transposase
MSDTELLPKSKVAPARRLEVFTGAGRRRSWSAEQKTQIVAESFESGETVSAVARRHGLTAQQLFGWRRQARPEGEGGRGDRAVAFARVVVESDQPRPSMPVAPRAMVIEIVIGAATIRVAPGADVAMVAALLRAVMAAP